MAEELPQLLMLIILCGHISLIVAQDCGWKQYFCSSTGTCIDKYISCNGNCPDEWPNLCDNGTTCYPKSYINDLFYDCADRSDEHRPIEKFPPMDNSSLDKFLQLDTGEEDFVTNYQVWGVTDDGDLGVDCQDGTVHSYKRWCKDEYKRMCHGVSTSDYFICTNSALMDRPCGEGWVRGLCKVPGKCIDVEWKCNGQVGNSLSECGASDYSDEVCPVNQDNLTKHSRYFICRDNATLIHPTLVCDGHEHCGDASDENECDICPRVNNMVVHGQVVQLKDEEIRDLAHLKNTAIMQCQSPYGQAVCATPGDGIPECAMESKKGVWQTQDEVELKSSRLWQTIFKYMSYIFLISVAVLFKILQLGFFCQKSTSDIPILTSYRRTIPLDDKPLPLAIPNRSFTTSESFPTPILTKTEPLQLTQKFMEYYIQNHGSKHFEEFFTFCLTLSQFLSTPTERDIFYCGIYAIEAKIHNMSPTCTDQCLKQQSSSALEPLFDAVYGSLSDRFPNKVKNILYTQNKLPWLHYLRRIQAFICRYFFFYYDIVQEYVLLSSILGTAGLGISKTFWLEASDFSYIHIMIYLYVSSVFLPTIFFSLQLAFSSQIGIIFGIKKPTIGQTIIFGFCCFIFSPFIPTVLFFKMEKKQMKMYNCAKIASKALKRLNDEDVRNVELLFLKHEIAKTSMVLSVTNTEIKGTKSLYKQFKEWELAIEMPIQCSLTTIFSFMKKSTTVVNQVFQNWFISDATSIVFLIGMSLRSIIAVQISDESARRNNFLGIKSKILLSPLFMTTSIPRIAAIVCYLAVPLGLMDLLGHWTVERQGIGYYFYNGTMNVTRLMGCIKESGFNISEKSVENYCVYSSIFSSDVSSTKYTAMNTQTYMVILMAILTSSVIINFVLLCLRSRTSLSEKILSSAKSVLSIIIHSDFDEDDECVRKKELHIHYMNKFSKVQMEYILKLLLHTGINMVLILPWALAYQAANERHQTLNAIGDCLGVKGTVEMEDISLERLWWGRWILPLLMAILGVVNYGLYRIYVKYGHPWKRLLTADNDRIEEWKTLKLWNVLENQNNYRYLKKGNSLNMWKASSVLSTGNDVGDMVTHVDVTGNYYSHSANTEKVFQKGKNNMDNEVGEMLDGKNVEVEAYFQTERQDNDEKCKNDVLNREDETIRDDDCMELIVDGSPNALMKIGDLQVEQGNECSNKDGIIDKDNVSVKDDFTVKVEGDSTEEDGICNKSVRKGNNYKHNEDMIGKEEDYRESDFMKEVDFDEGHKRKDMHKINWEQEKVGKENVSMTNDHCIKRIYIVDCKDKEHRTKLSSENGSEEKVLVMEQVSDDKDKETHLSSENILIGSKQMVIETKKR